MKLLVLVVGMALTLGVAYVYLGGTRGQGGQTEVSEAKRTLDEVREKTRAFEQAQGQKAADVAGQLKQTVTE